MLTLYRPEYGTDRRTDSWLVRKSSQRRWLTIGRRPSRVYSPWSRSNICYFGHFNPFLIDWLIDWLLQQRQVDGAEWDASSSCRVAYGTLSRESCVITTVPCSALASLPPAAITRPFQRHAGWWWWWRTTICSVNDDTTTLPAIDTTRRGVAHSNDQRPTRAPVSNSSPHRVDFYRVQLSAVHRTVGFAPRPYSIRHNSYPPLAGW